MNKYIAFLVAIAVMCGFFAFMIIHKTSSKTAAPVTENAETMPADDTVIPDEYVGAEERAEEEFIPPSEETGSEEVLDAPRESVNEGLFSITFGDGYTLTVGSDEESWTELYPLMICPRLYGYSGDVAIIATVNHGVLKTDAGLGTYISRREDTSSECLYVVSKFGFDTLRHASELCWGKQYDTPVPESGIHCDLHLVKLDPVHEMLGSFSVNIEEIDNKFCITGITDNLIYEESDTIALIKQTGLIGAEADYLLSEDPDDISILVEKVSRPFFARVRLAGGKGAADAYSISTGDMYAVTINDPASAFGFMTLYLDAEYPYTYRFRNPVKLNTYDEYLEEIYPEGFLNF